MKIGTLFNFEVTCERLGIAQENRCHLIFWPYSALSHYLCAMDVFGKALRDFYQKASGEGYAGFYGTGEMSWARKGMLGSEQFLRYEAQLNCLNHPLTALCQYDVNLFDGETLLNVLRIHPWVFIQGQIIRDPNYMEPAEFLAQLDAAPAPACEHRHMH